MAVRIPLVTTFSAKGIKAAIKEFKALDGVIAKAAFVAKKTMLPATVALAGGTAVLGKVLFDAAQAAAADQSAQARLAKQLENVAGATAFNVQMAESYIGTLEQATGIADDELRPALGRLATVTGNVTRAQELLALAVDISAGSGQSLEETSGILTAALMGQYKGLKTLGIEYEATGKKTKDLQNVLRLLRDAFEGQAAVAADTFEGKVRILKTSLGNLQETIGYYVLPYVTKFVDMLNEKIVPALRVVVDEMGDKGIKGGFVALAASMGDSGKTMVDIMEGIAKAFVSVGQVFIEIGKPMLVVIGNIAAGLTLLFTGSFDKASAMFAKFETAYVTLNNFKYGVDDVTAAFGKLRGDIKSTTYRLGMYQNAQRNTNRNVVQAETRMSNYGKKLVAVRPEIDATTDSTKKLGSRMDALKVKADAMADALSKKMADALDKAKEKLAEQEALYNEVKDGVTDAIGGVVDFGEAADYAAERGGTSFFDALDKQANKAKKFGQLVERLLAAGLSRDALLQVVNAGVDAGTYIAEELLKSSENILRANKLVEETQKIAENIGKLAADKFHAAGVANAKAYLKGLEDTIAAAELILKTAKTPADVKAAEAVFAQGAAAAQQAGVTAGTTAQTAADAAAAAAAAATPAAAAQAAAAAAAAVVTATGGAAAAATAPAMEIPFPEFYDPAFAASAEGQALSIIINTVTAPADLGDTIVDALRDYNRRSGPLQLMIE